MENRLIENQFEMNGYGAQSYMAMYHHAAVKAKKNDDMEKAKEYFKKREQYFVECQLWDAILDHDERLIMEIGTRLRYEFNASAHCYDVSNGDYSVPVEDADWGKFKQTGYVKFGKDKDTGRMFMRAFIGYEQTPLDKVYLDEAPKTSVDKYVDLDGEDFKFE